MAEGKLILVDAYCKQGGATKGRERELGRANGAEEWREAMGIDWMTVEGLAQAIPPAYTRYIGYFQRAHIQPVAELERAA